MSEKKLPEWEHVLSSAARLQGILPEAVLVGGTASALYAQHRFSKDADHVLTDLKSRFDDVLAQLESVAGWKTARINRPVQILGSLDGIETGIRQLIREKPLETAIVDYHGQKLNVPTEGEILRIKGAMILRRNATRDYLDFIALTSHLGDERTAAALKGFDQLYPQPNGESALQQLQIQLARPMPYDLDEVNLREYKHLAPRWHDWNQVTAACAHCAKEVFNRLAELEADPAQGSGGEPNR